MRVTLLLFLFTILFSVHGQNQEEAAFEINEHFGVRGIIIDSSTLKDVQDTFDMGRTHRKHLWYSSHHIHLHGKNHHDIEDHESFYYFHKIRKLGLAFFTSSQDSMVINRVTIRSKKFGTKGGIRIGKSTKEDVIKAYGQPHDDGLSLEEETVLWYPDLGLIFTFHKRSRLRHWITGHRKVTKKLKGISIS